MFVKSTDYTMKERVLPFLCSLKLILKIENKLRNVEVITSFRNGNLSRVYI